MAKFGDDVKPLFSKGPPLSLKVLVFVLVSLTLMFMDQRLGNLRPLRLGLSAVVQPVQWIADIPASISSLGDYFQSREQLRIENRALKRQAVALRSRLERLHAVEAENRRIRALLQSAEKMKHRVLMASVLAASPDPYRNYIMLNKGSLDGVYKGQPLIDAYGVMGQVTQVGLMSSMAILLTDPDYGIPVEINRNGVQTIAEGDGEGQGLRLPYLPANADIRQGDQLVTSGLGGRYPAGYPVGTVTRVRHRAGQYFLSVRAKPAAHLHRGREVLLVWNHTAGGAGKQPRSPNPPASSAATP